MTTSIVSNLYIDAAFSPTTKKAGWAANLIYRTSKTQKNIIFYSPLNPPYITHNCTEALAALNALSIVLSTGLSIERLNIYLDSYYAMRLLYKHYHTIIYFPCFLDFPKSFKEKPMLAVFPIEEYYMPLIKNLQNKILTQKTNIGVFHVKSHVEAKTLVKNKHQENNNKTDAYAKIAREAAEKGELAKLSIVSIT